MSRIQILKDEVIDKIAAGEVVERPASVVKELVENAIDAGARRIEVALELGGTRRITVSDDGCGMDPGDAVLALKRHATSKIKSADDLVHVTTMGFRGEALAAIAAVSRFTLATRPKGADAGTRIVIAPGEAPVQTAWQGAEGTSITVEQLFLNVPARAKFLKSPTTELGHVAELLQSLALCHPEVAFSLTHNGRSLLRAPAAAGAGDDPYGEASLRARAKAVLGEEVAASLLYLRHSNARGTVTALLSPPGIEKASSRYLYLIVNGRAVKDKTMRFGLLRGYHAHLLKGRFPVAVLNLVVDPTIVDVNVHPAKTEVRFQYADEVQSLIATAVRERLREPTWTKPPIVAADAAKATPPAARPITGAARAGEHHDAPSHQAGGAAIARPKSAREEVPWARAAGGDSKGSVSRTRTTSFASPLPSALVRGPASSAVEAVSDKAGIERMLGLNELVETHVFDESAALDEAKNAGQNPSIPWSELEFLGSFARCYLLFEMPDLLLVVDQHAFHERILFERLRLNEGLLTASQPLLVPEVIELDVESLERLEQHASQLRRQGFEYIREGLTSLCVKAVPSLLARAELGKLMHDLAERLGDSEAARELVDPLLATYACHGAVRAGEELGERELVRLLGEAESVDFYHVCPHGRRVFRWWSKDQVAQWFDR